MKRSIGLTSDEVADRLRPATELLWATNSGLLCHALAVGPKVLLMDEPCASLDPISIKNQDCCKRLKILLQSSS